MITNIENGKQYVGQSRSIFTRWSEHIEHALNPSYKNTLLYEDINKYGVESFLFSILILCPPEKLDELENFYIAKFSTITKGYNVTVNLDKNNTKLLSQDEFEKLKQSSKEKLDSRIRQRQREGIEIAKSKGKYAGRKKIKVDKEAWESCRSRYAGRTLSKSKWAKELGISRPTLDKLIKEYDNGIDIFIERKN